MRENKRRKRKSSPYGGVTTCGHPHIVRETWKKTTTVILQMFSRLHRGKMPNMICKEFVAWLEVGRTRQLAQPLTLLISI